MIYLPHRRAAFRNQGDAFTKLLLHLDETDAAFVDSSAAAHAVSNTGVTYSASGKFGGAAVFSSGAVNYLSTANHADFNLAAKTKWTVDFQVNPAGTSGYRSILSKRSGSNPTSYQFGIDSSSNRVYLFNGPGSYDSTAEIPAEIFTHVAFTFNNGTLKIWINGALDSTHTGVTLTELDQPVEIGYHFSSVSEQFIGLLDELRLSDIVRWTANFTPPIAAYR